MHWIVTVDRPRPGQAFRAVYLIRDGELLPVHQARDRRDIDKLLREYGIDPRVVAWVGDDTFPMQARPA